MSNANNPNTGAVTYMIKVRRNSRRSRNAAVSEPTFPCPLCPNSYTEKEQLMSHITEQHPSLVDENGRSKFDASHSAYEKLVTDMIKYGAQPGSLPGSVKLCLNNANNIEQVLVTLPVDSVGEILQDQQPNASNDNSGDDNTPEPTSG